MTENATERDLAEWNGKDPTRIVVRFEYADAPTLERVYPGADHRTIAWETNTRAEPLGDGERAVMVNRITFSWEYAQTPVPIDDVAFLLEEKDRPRFDAESRAWLREIQAGWAAEGM